MLLRIEALPDEPLEAAARFYGEVLERVEAILSRRGGHSPLPFTGGAGGGDCPDSSLASDMPHPDPSPEGEGLSHLVILFATADHTHRAWRMAAVQELARQHAPVRVNAIASDDEAAIAAAVVYLADAPGVTGQYLPLDGNGAG